MTSNYSMDDGARDTAQPDVILSDAERLALVFGGLEASDDGMCVTLDQSGGRCPGYVGIYDKLCSMHHRRVSRITADGYGLCPVTTRQGYCLRQVSDGWEHCIDHPEMEVSQPPDWLERKANRDSNRRKKDATPKFTGAHIIRLLVVINPKRTGTDAWRRFALYRDGMTVNEYRELGGGNIDLRWDRQKGYILMDPPTENA